MRRHSLQTALLSILLASQLGSSGIAAPPEPTAAEKLYEKLKDAEKQADRQLAERWHVLVRQRQWTDRTGKYKTFARYIDHDPNLQWVKLSVVVKKGEVVNYKETTIPLSKLGKTEQSLVKRISMVRPQIEQAAAGAPDAAVGAIAEGAPVGVVAGLPPDAAAMETALRSGALPPGAELAAGRELPPGVSPPGAGPTPGQPMNEPWRTDFAAFAANLTAPVGEDPSPGWGELHALKAVHEKEQMLGMFKQLPKEQRPPKPVLFQQGFAYGWARAALGEVHWQATIAGPSTDTEVAGALQHDLSAPSPWKISLVPDPEYAGDLARFATGGPVQLVGRFAEVGGAAPTPHIKLYVRLPSDKQK